MFHFRLRRALPFFLAAAAATAFVGCHRHHGPSFKQACADPDAKVEKATKHIASKLDLSDTQKNEVKELVRATLEDVCQMKPEHTEMHRLLIADLRAGQADTAAIAAQMEKVKSRFDTLKANMVLRYAKLHATLTPEQRGKLANLIEKHMGE
jgi:Spy/CpxP family protein refolding chaperone